MIEHQVESSLDDALTAFRFLSDRNRLRILMTLARAETCVCDLIDDLQLPQPLVSYHLSKLRSAGIVRSRREAQWIYYSIDPLALDTLLAPVSSLLGSEKLPPEAAYGAGRRCAPAIAANGDR